jgi:condensin complex subunit 3
LNSGFEPSFPAPQFVVSVHNAKDKAVRFRACQIINNILKDLDEDTEIDDELWQGLQAALLLRIRDKIALVRVEAVKALTRLQVVSHM